MPEMNKESALKIVAMLFDEEEMSIEDVGQELYRYEDGDYDFKSLDHDLWVINTFGGEGCGDTTSVTFAIGSLTDIDHAKKLYALDDGLEAKASALNTLDIFTIYGYYDSYGGFDWGSADMYKEQAQVISRIEFA